MWQKQSQELTRGNPDRNIFSINVKLTSTFLLYIDLLHHHHWILDYFFSPKLFSERFGKYVNLPLEHVYHVFSFRSLHTPGHNSPYPGTLALQTLSSQLSKQTIDFLFFITFSQFSRLGSWLCAKRKNDGVCI